MDPGVKIVVRANPDAATLDLALTNERAVPLTINRHALPWVGWYSIVLIAAMTDAIGTILEPATPVDDPLVGTITLQPGETLTGAIDLTRRFPGWKAAVNQRDVAVFWTYQVTPVDGDPLPRTGGYQLIQKTPPTASPTGSR